jgi:hypothetical protein
VHSKENILYQAAQALISLPTGLARLAYVGEAGPVVGLIHVPLVKSRAKKCLASRKTGPPAVETPPEF